jgi:hypothetical protein
MIKTIFHILLNRGTQHRSASSPVAAVNNTVGASATQTLAPTAMIAFIGKSLEHHHRRFVADAA